MQFSALSNAKTTGIAAFGAFYIKIANGLFRRSGTDYVL
jgi:hypothetical protein